jgi:4'-phosphopantetheinyl transferase
VLSQYFTEVPEKSWIFEQNQYGKPAISDQNGRYRVKFNLAHTDGLVTLAITPEQDIGVDVEHTDRSISVSDIADRYFSEQERSELSHLPDNRKSERFFELWTLKESYIKALGMGLSLPLDRISFNLKNNLDIGF